MVKIKVMVKVMVTVMIMVEVMVAAIAKVMFIVMVMVMVSGERITAAILRKCPYYGHFITEKLLTIMSGQLLQYFITN